MSDHQHDRHTSFLLKYSHRALPYFFLNEHDFLFHLHLSNAGRAKMTVHARIVCRGNTFSFPYSAPGPGREAIKTYLYCNNVATAERGTHPTHSPAAERGPPLRKRAFRARVRGWSVPHCSRGFGVRDREGGKERAPEAGCSVFFLFWRVRLGRDSGKEKRVRRLFAASFAF